MNTVSVVIPCYRSAPFLEKTVTEILDAFSRHPGYSPRIILVDDASGDGTADAIRRLMDHFEEVDGIFLPENGGQAGARMAGVRRTEASFGVFMDDDGQHPPEDLFRLLKKVRKGYDLVYAQFPYFPYLRCSGKNGRAAGETVVRSISSAMTNLLLTLQGKKPPFLRITSFYAVSPRALDALRASPPGTALAGTVVMKTFGRKSLGGLHVQIRKGSRPHSSYTPRSLVLAFQKVMKA